MRIEMFRNIPAFRSSDDEVEVAAGGISIRLKFDSAIFSQTNFGDFDPNPGYNLKSSQFISSRPLYSWVSKTAIPRLLFPYFMISIEHASLSIKNDNFKIGQKLPADKRRPFPEATDGAGRRSLMKSQYK
jgi:hypothetical protein